VEQAEQTHPKHDARVAVTGCTACSAVARTRRHVAGHAPGCSMLPGAPGVRGGVLPLRMRGAPTAAAVRGLSRKTAGQANSTLHSAHTRRGIVPRGAGNRCLLSSASALSRCFPFPGPDYNL
jgi:hypothetical protein